MAYRLYETNMGEGGWYMLMGMYYGVFMGSLEGRKVGCFFCETEMLMRFGKN
jgi:hypothetical protein